VPWDTELFRVINDVVKAAMEDAVVGPGMTIGAPITGSYGRRASPPTASSPACSPQRSAGFHGNNEFLTIDNLNMGVELMYEVVRRMCV
jgi:acetylornithine deacetylase/succinyl-diaminopimelate desuccinylase-like protein